MKNELSQEQNRDVITDLALRASWYALTHGLKFFEDSFVNINEQGLFWLGLENQSSVGRTVDYMHPDLQREHVTSDLAVWSYENGRFRFASLAGG